MSNCKSVNIPLVAHFKPSSKTYPTSAVEIKKMSHAPYSSAVVSLMYVMVYTRPDLVSVVGVVIRYMHSPGKYHWGRCEMDPSLCEGFS